MSIKNHLDALNTAMLENELKILNTPHLKASTLVQIHKQQHEIQAAFMWIQNIDNMVNKPKIIPIKNDLSIN
jgi:hypothetical protein